MKYKWVFWFFLTPVFFLVVYVLISTYTYKNVKKDVFRCSDLLCNSGRKIYFYVYEVFGDILSINPYPKYVYLVQKTFFNYGTRKVLTAYGNVKSTDEENVVVSLNTGQTIILPKREMIYRYFDDAVDFSTKKEFSQYRFGEWYIKLRQGRLVSLNWVYSGMGTDDAREIVPSELVQAVPYFVGIYKKYE